MTSTPLPVERGFLPSPDPLTRLPPGFEVWDEVGYDLPKLLAAGRARAVQMRRYMPPAHVAFLARLEAGPSVRSFVLASGEGALRETYDACLELLEAFRSTHLDYAAKYIQRQAQVGANTTQYGTGGTPFMRYLRKHRDETHAHMLATQ